MTTTQIVRELKESASIVALLNRLGYQPVPKHGRETMYVSMLRDNDRNPSLSVNDKLGVWYDHGSGKGGNIIDLGLAYWPQLTFSQVIEKLRATLALTTVEPRERRPRKAVKIPHYMVRETKPIGNHPAITGYLEGRGILDTARNYLSEVYYYVRDEKGRQRNFYSAGWQNDCQAWEVRNRLFKGCMGPKAITFLPGHLRKAALFEGFMDFLSWKTEHPEADHSIIVLNSASLLTEGISKARDFPSVDVFFDRDETGVQATAALLKFLPYAVDLSGYFDGFKDYNDKIRAEKGARVSPVPLSGLEPHPPSGLRR